MDDHSPRVIEAARLLAYSSRVLVVTGAGASAASGLPTYRGVGGLYDDPRNFIPPWLTLSRWCLRYFPGLTWRTLRSSIKRSRDATPNATHDAVAIMGALAHVTVLTQNVDGFHQEAGSDDVIEIHGSARTFSCTARCGHRTETIPEHGVPRCPDCGMVVRPDVVLFGEDLPDPAVDRLVQVLAEDIDLIIVVGTTVGFSYVQDAIVSSGGSVVFIDPSPCDFARDIADVLIEGRAEEVLPEIVNLSWDLLSPAPS